MGLTTVQRDCAACDNVHSSPVAVWYKMCHRPGWLNN